MANAAQPASNKLESPTSVNWFGAPPNNSNRAAIQYSNWMQTQDATLPTNLVSPLAVTNTATTTVNIPQNATTMTLTAATIALRVSEVAPTSNSLTQWTTLPVGVPTTINVARQALIYLQADAAGTSTASFFFQTM